MIYYRCKCGQCESWGSMPPARCNSCPTCGSNLATGPDEHREPESHQWFARYDEKTGEPYEVCGNCLQKKLDVEAKNK